MQSMGRRGAACWWPAAAAGVLALGAAGCANPGAPQPPSLHLPSPVRGMTAQREGDTVTVHFSVSQRTTDNLPVREAELGLSLCRETAGASACVPVPGTPATVPTRGAPAGVTVVDHLPPALTQGVLRELRYRAELRNRAGRSAGLSEPALTLAGAAPAPVTGLAAQGSRLGVVLSWGEDGNGSGTLYLRRLNQAAPGAKDVLLRFDPAAASKGTRLLDTSAAEDTPYVYSAYRERRITVGGHTLPVRSAESAPVSFTLRDVFPPPAPADVTAAPVTAANGSYGVDLIWQPVEDPGLAGYNVYREPLGGVNGAPAAAREKLTPTPVQEPAFHDTGVQPGLGYRWTVTAIDRKGNESAGASVVVGPEKF